MRSQSRELGAAAEIPRFRRFRRGQASDAAVGSPLWWYPPTHGRRRARQSLINVVREEIPMTKLFAKIGLAHFVVLLTALSLSAIPAAAEKREQTYTKTNFRTASKSVIPIGDGHELIQEVVVADIKYSNPDFKIKDEWTYNHNDLVNGSGPTKGFYVDTHEDGSQTYGDYVGTLKVVTKSDGSWEASWEGMYKYLGGTGKFKNIKGSGTYKGSMSSANPGGLETGKETVEY
jgi:hypothetical protein